MGMVSTVACRGYSLKTHGYAYSPCVRSVLLDASETCAATEQDISRLHQNDLMMKRWRDSTKLTDKVPSDELRSRMGLCSTKNVMRLERLCWCRHLLHMDPDAYKTIVPGNNPSLAQNTTDMTWQDITARYPRGNDSAVVKPSEVFLSEPDYLVQQH